MNQFLKLLSELLPRREKLSKTQIMVEETSVRKNQIEKVKRTSKVEHPRILI